MKADASWLGGAKNSTSISPLASSFVGVIGSWVNCQSVRPFVRSSPRAITRRESPVTERTRHWTTYGERTLPQFTVRNEINDRRLEDAPSRCTTFVPGLRAKPSAKAPAVKSARTCRTSSGSGASASTCLTITTGACACSTRRCTRRIRIASVLGSQARPSCSWASTSRPTERPAGLSRRHKFPGGSASGVGA